MRLSVVVPMRDEEANVRPLAERLRRALGPGPDWELVAIDDGSRDGTFAELSRLAAEDGRVRVVRLRRNFGQSAALQAGFDHATGDVVATLDGDGQNDPADLPAMLLRLESGGYDVVLGERAARRDGFWLRLLPSLCANWVIRRVTGVPFRDFGCTLRVMRRDVIDGLRLYGEMHRFITAFAVQGGAKVAQVPVRHHPRTAGATKYGLGRTFRVLLDLLTVTFLARFQSRPMHLFGGLGLVSGGLGGACLAAACWIKLNGCDTLLTLGAVLSVAAAQFVSLGLVGELLARTYFESQGRRPYRVRETRNFPGPKRRKSAIRSPQSAIEQWPTSAPT